MTPVTVLGVVAGALQLAAFAVYIRQARCLQNTPNGVSWTMWSYGSLVLLYIAADTGAPPAVLLAPGLCALCALHVAASALVRRRYVPAARHDWAILGLDLAILGGYLGFASGAVPAAGMATAFLLLPAASSVLSCWPTLRSTCLDPRRERPGPWFLWSLSYGLMAFAVMAEGLPWPHLAYPVLTQAANLAIGVMALGSAESARPGRSPKSA